MRQPTALLVIVGIPAESMGHHSGAGNRFDSFLDDPGRGSNGHTSGTRLIQTEGRGSYEIYLGHMLVVLGLIPFIVKLQPDASIPMWYFAMVLLSVVSG